MKTITTPDKSNLPIRHIEDKYPQLFEEISKSEREKSVILDAMTELVFYLDTDLYGPTRRCMTHLTWLPAN
jgi:hypothetical protein